MIVRRIPSRGVLALAASLLLLLAVAVGPASAAAPAGAAERASYRTQSLPAGAPMAAGARAGTARSTRIVLRSARRFSLAALRWTDGDASIAGRMRAQRTDGTWTAWSTFESAESGEDGAAEAPDPAEAAAAVRAAGARASQGTTEPTWTGPSRLLQVELRGRRPKGLRAAFVDVTGTVPHVARAARASAADDATAGIQPRSAWDPNDQCKPRANAATGSVQAVVVHHTAGSNAYTQAQVPAVLLAICKFHRNANGWNDIGYNVLVDQFGGAWEGRAGGLAEAVIGAHAQGFNTTTAGISMIGDYSVVPPSAATIATVSRVAAWKLAVAGVPRTGTVALTSAGGSLARFKGGSVTELPRVMAHRDVGLTACPGDAGYAILDGVRASVAAANPVVPVDLPVSEPVEVAPPAKITISTARRLAVGATAVVSGTATVRGVGAKGARLALQVGSGASWQTVATTTSGSAGRYRFARKFTRSWGVRVVRTDEGGGSSALVAFVVVPRLRLTVPARMRVNQRITLRGTIAPGRGPVTLLVERRTSSGSYVAGAPQSVRVSGRRLTVTITPHSAALYRFRLRYAGGELAAAARSPLAYGRAVRATSGGGVTG